MSDDPEEVERVEVHEALRTLVRILGGPHIDHTGIDCDMERNRTDCCWHCSLLEGVLESASESNHITDGVLEPIAMPSRPLTQRIHVLSPVSEKHRDKYCPHCWHRLEPAATYDVEMKERYDIGLIENIGLRKRK